VEFLDYFINSFCTYEMVSVYSALLDTNVLLFFRGVFMIPIALLGLLLFIGVEKKSFNLVLYPTLLLLLMILLRYGSEMALLLIHWEDHATQRGPNLVFYLIIDLAAVIVLLTYVYVSLAAPPPPPTQDGVMTRSRLNSLRRKLQRLQFHKGLDRGGDEEERLDVEAINHASWNNKATTEVEELVKKRRKPPAVPPPEVEEAQSEPPSRPPPSPKFNYKLRRNIGATLVASHAVDERKMIEDLDKQRQRNSQMLLPQEEPEVAEEEEVVVVVFPPPPPPKLSPKSKSQSLKTYHEEPKRRSLLVETDLDTSPTAKMDHGESATSGGDEGGRGEWGWEVEEEGKPKDDSDYKMTSV